MTETVVDPVCGMEISPESAVTQEDHDGTTFYFCSDGCHKAFLNDPHRFGDSH